MLKLYGIVGRNLEHSFSPQYFTEKFSKEGITNCEYKKFSLNTIDLLPALLHENPNLVGFNVTIPYKTEILPFIDIITPEVKLLQATNVVKIQTVNNQKQSIAYNTDVIGFEQSLLPLLKPHHKKALILGIGGAAKAVAFVLKKLGIEFVFVSRNSKNTESIEYAQITKNILQEYTLIINTTPLGMYPNVSTCVEIPFEYISSRHLCYDLVYNPQKTVFLQKSQGQGAVIKNGIEMLHLQADAAWEIWNKY